MSDETSVNRPEPEWVDELRAAGFTVRVGAGAQGLGDPKVSFHDFDDPHIPFGQRLTGFLHDLGITLCALTRRIVHW